ncbi:ATP-binding protein [Vibrio gazogenes]|uniref:histidine kinase n=1 Tax=Vibrio gazogenes DSM 21264 = NBRC 103151 TaxID=1123492 RepID=A0A1M4SPF6_VIBGA|nr:ATP-binding protein [Vibrio gazogenes]USP15917.1 ATP-binding protein [Vibrio gazogenes]SHE34049.1 Histidine kinase-, DNA gyrase B-, and HSP90-like ATPase [Vibrio gazogenes DSM 21264] [Vibrio gazogenes DSM 21264 = NBRC 103151]SJN59334.1 Sporulation kinase A [Vibrio gazogenes]
MTTGKYSTELISPLRSRLGRRVMFILILLSSVFTLISTVAQLYFDYTQHMDHIEKRHIEIRDVHTHVLASFMWDFNLTRLQQRMDHLVLLSDIDYLKVQSGNYNLAVGQPLTSGMIRHVYPLTVREPVGDETKLIGTITVESSLENIYNTLIRKFLTTLAINTLKTILVCYLILVIFHRSINQRIYSIVRFLQRYNPINPGTQLEVYQAPFITQHDDELSLLVKETNKLTQSLGAFYQSNHLERTRSRHFALISSDWLWETDDSLRLIYASEGMLNALHLSERHPVPFKQIEALQPAQGLHCFLTHKQSFQQCEVIIILDGIRQWFVFQALARYNDAHEFLGFRGTALNISELKSGQLALKQLNQELEYKVRQRTDELAQNMTQLKRAQTQLIQSEKFTALGGLVAGVAHEVNTPLGIAVTATSIAEDVRKMLEESFHHQTLTTHQFTELTQQLNSSVKLLKSNLTRASQLMQNFKQTAVDQISECQSQFNIYQVLQALIVSMYPETRKVPVDPVLEGDKNLMMNSFPGSLTQVVANLIINSTRHAFRNTPVAPQIVIRFYVEDESIVFEYLDNGIGIPEDLHQKIFEPFYTTQRGHGGSGLGLSLVFNLVTQRLQGTLQFSSTPGQGLHYRLKLPGQLKIQEPETVS